MSCEVATLPFQANANYGTLLIDFDFIKQNCLKRLNTLKMKKFLPEIRIRQHVIVLFKSLKDCERRIKKKFNVEI